MGDTLLLFGDTNVQRSEPGEAFHRVRELSPEAEGAVCNSGGLFLRFSFRIIAIRMPEWTHFEFAGKRVAPLPSLIQQGPSRRDQVQGWAANRDMISSK